MNPVKLVGSLSLEVSDELKQITVRMKADKERVKMIGHYAVGVNSESIGLRLPTQMLDQPCRSFRRNKLAAPSLATDCDEMPVLSLVVVSSKPDIFMKEGLHRNTAPALRVLQPSRRK